MSYCDAAKGHPFHGPYHDQEYGFPVTGDAPLLERLALEINQAGLSWLTILKKREAFREAFRGFDPEKVARFGAREKARLLANPGIVRNRLKVDAVVENAGRIRTMRKQGSGFAAWLDANHPLTRDEWTRLFRKTFVFTGGEITSSFLISVGYLPGAHEPDCAVYRKVTRMKPAWMRG